MICDEEEQLQGPYFYARGALKRLVLDNQSELSVQIDVVDESKHACIPFPSIGSRKNIRECTRKSTESSNLTYEVF